MLVNKKLADFISKAKESDTYWVEKAKLDFAISLEGQRRKAGMTCADLAKKIASSAAYISKVFRGDSNMTIESMVKLARAAGAQLEIKVVDQQEKKAEKPADWGCGRFVIFPVGRQHHQITSTSASAVTASNAEQDAAELKAA